MSRTQIALVAPGQLSSPSTDLLEEQSIDELRDGIKVWMNESIQSWWEIGRRLAVAKKKVAYGEWGRWLEDNFDMSRQTAHKMMQLANGKIVASMRQLSWSKAIELIRALPNPEDQEDFLEAEMDTPGGPKMGKDLSQREMKRALAEWKETPVQNETGEDEKEEASRNCMTCAYCYHLDDSGHDLWMCRKWEEKVSEEDEGCAEWSPESQSQQLECDRQQESKPHVSNNSGDDEWYTPPEIIEAARDTMGRIDLDPASSHNAQDTVKAEVYYTKEDCGEQSPWRGNVWLNPPYGRGLIEPFVSKLIESLGGSVHQAITLTNNATETVWFQELLPKASAICFFSGRISFNSGNGKPSKTPLQGQIALYFGRNKKQFCQHFSQFGFTALL